MPTYRNNTTGAITVTDPMGGTVSFAASETKTSKFILTDTRITQTLPTPYYNPLHDDIDITLGISTSTTYTTETASRYIRLIPIVGTIKVFINTVSNTPGITLLEPTTIINRGKISALYFTNIDLVISTINLKEIW